MTWIVDTCVLLDVHLNDPVFGRQSAECLAHLLPHGLAISEITAIELAPAFKGDALLRDNFLGQVGVAHQGHQGATWREQDTSRAFAAWHDHVMSRRASGGTLARRPVADLLIATVACRYAGVVTRNTAHFRAFFDRNHLAVVDPTQRSSWP